MHSRDRIQQMTILDPRPMQGVPCYGIPEQSGRAVCICLRSVGELYNSMLARGSEFSKLGRFQKKNFVFVFVFILIH